MKNCLPPFLILILSALTTCGQKTFDEKMQSLYKNTVPLVNADQLKEKLSTGIVLLDTRAPEEYAVSHISGARLVDYDKFKMKDVKDISKDTEVIVYCSVGYRSERIGEKLKAAGYKNVKNLYGGIFDWKNKGYDVIDSEDKVTEKVHTYNKTWGQWLYKGEKIN